MTHNLILADDPTSTRTSRLLPRCVVLAFAAGVVFYGVYSVIQSPVNGMTSGHSGNTNCNCDSARNLEKSDGGRVFYNRVPKCGSTTLITLMRQLSIRNHFRHFNSKVYDKKYIDEREQRRIVNLVSSTPSPCSFDRHVFFLNFTKFGERPPIFINLIREPVERIISSFFYRRLVARQNKTKIKPSAYWLNKKFEHCVLTPDPECTFLEGNNYSMLQVPYFCGQDTECQLLNDENALQKAKRNIEKYFSVVGTLEQINRTLQVLESVLPNFFEGAFEVYHTLGLHRNQNLHKEHVKEEVKAVLKANLTGEYELYNFVQQRLYQQYQMVVQNDHSLYEYPLTNIDDLLDYQ